MNAQIEVPFASLETGLEVKAAMAWEALFLSDQV